MPHHSSRSKKSCGAYDGNWRKCSAKSRNCIYMADSKRCVSRDQHAILHSTVYKKRAAKPCSAYDGDWAECSKPTRKCIYMADTGKCHSAKQHSGYLKAIRKTKRKASRKASGRKVKPCNQLTKHNSCRYREFKAKSPNRNCMYLGGGVCRPKNY